MYIYFDEDNLPDEWTQDTMTNALSEALAEEKLPPDNASVCVSFVGLDEIHELNRSYRGVDRPTDVLSFPAFEPDEVLKASENEDEFCIGDVVICKDRAKEQAAEFGHSYERELIYLFVHSIFHLLGYDHEQEDEKKIMREKEEVVMNRLGITR